MRKKIQYLIILLPLLGFVTGNTIGCSHQFQQYPGHKNNSTIVSKDEKGKDNDILAINNTFVRFNLIDRLDNLADIGGPTGGGIYFWGPNRRDITIENNKFYGGAANGMTLNNMKANNFMLRNNQFHRNEGIGISFSKSVAGDNFTISGNSILDSGEKDISILATLTNSAISDNKVSTTADGIKGFNLTEEQPKYNDIYSKVRYDKSETAWASEPNDLVNLNVPIINVKEYGAKGDGATNDFIAFYNAIQALPDSGGQLQIPEGTYKIDVPKNDASKYTMPYTIIKHHLLIKNKSNIHITGAGSGSIIVFTNPDYQGLRLVNIRNSSIRDVSFKLDKQPVTRHNRALLDIATSYDVIVNNVDASNSSGPGIYVDASTRVAVNSSKVENAGTHGISVAASRQVFIKDNEIASARDNGIHITHTGGVSREPQYIKIGNNRVVGTREGSGIGIANGDHIEVSNNDVRDTHLAGIHIYQATMFYPLKNIKVENNTISNCNLGANIYTGGAISCTMSAGVNEDNPILSSIEIKNNIINNTPKYGVYIDRFKAINMIIDSNTIKGAARGDIFRTVKNDGSFKSIINNYVER